MFLLLIFRHNTLFNQYTANSRAKYAITMTNIISLPYIYSTDKDERDRKA